ncbi:MAG: nicotinate mononucleotide-dependent phosphoribosyltransferase CobT [Candidatus Odinarchaeota archaeon]
MEDIIKIGENSRVNDFLSKVNGKKPLFLCVIGNTETAKIPGISAAGINPEFTDFTPAADMEYLYYKKCKSIKGVPITPNGIPTPAIITKASLDLANISCLVAVGGLRVYPKTPYIEFGGTPGGNISIDLAVKNSRKVFQNAKNWGIQISKIVDYLVIGESIAGGTTTALGVLTVMGFDAKSKISSSLPINPIELKIKTVNSGLKNNNLKPGDLKYRPFAAIKYLGDPMQPVYAGLVIGAAKRIPIILAGGTQIAAILAVINSIEPSILENLAIGTTRWIISNKTTDLKGIVDQINPNIPIFAANLNFSHMKYDGLKAYEQGAVKEGVGAGGSVIASIFSTKGLVSIDKINQKIEHDYKAILKK